MTLHLVPRTLVRHLLTASFTLLALAACRPGTGAGAGGGKSANSDTMTVTVEVTDRVVGGGRVTVTVRDRSGPVSGAGVEVQGDMTHAGMVPVIVAAVEAEPGVYEAQGFAFTMAGDWIVTAEVEAGGRRAEAESFVTVGW